MAAKKFVPLTGYVHPLTPSEMIIVDLMPRGEVVYAGTWTQLTSEGVLSDKVRMPASATSPFWVEGIFWYWLRRCLPEGASSKDCPGPVDYWKLHVRLAGHERDGFAAARRYALEQELEQAKFNLSRAADLQFQRWSRAFTDEKFQALLVQVGAKKTRKARKPRAKRAPV